MDVHCLMIALQETIHRPGVDHTIAQSENGKVTDRSTAKRTHKASHPNPKRDSLAIGDIAFVKPEAVKWTRLEAGRALRFWFDL